MSEICGSCKAQLEYHITGDSLERLGEASRGPRQSMTGDSLERLEEAEEARGFPDSAELDAESLDLAKWRV